MEYHIKRSPLQNHEWHVYAPVYCGAILLMNGVYEARPYTPPIGKPRWAVAAFSEINLAADYLVGAKQ